MKRSAVLLTVILLLMYGCTTENLDNNDSHQENALNINVADDDQETLSNSDSSSGNEFGNSGDMSNEDNAETGDHQDDESWMNPSPDSLPLTMDEIETFVFHNSKFSIDDAIVSGAVKVYDELTGETTYSLDFLDYVFSTDFSEDAFKIRITGNGDFTHIRDIHIGMSMEDVLTKFPQETNWEITRNGFFYKIEGFGSGSVEFTSIPDKDGVFVDRYHITITINDEMPFLVIAVRDGVVEYYELIYMIFT